MVNNHFIYLYTFPNGKYYVGQTYHGSHRYGRVTAYKRQVVYKAMKKYPDYKKEILVDNLSDSEVDDFEVYYIKQYQSLIDQNGYNMDTGGNLNKNHSEETKKKISISHIGIVQSEETRRKKSKSILQFSKSGEFIKEWCSSREIERKLNISHSHISNCCRNKYGYRTAGGYIWRYKDGK